MPSPGPSCLHTLQYIIHPSFFILKNPLFAIQTNKGNYHGAGDEAQTRYLHLGKVALYRMSYTRGTRGIITDFADKSIPFFKILYFSCSIIIMHL